METLLQQTVNGLVVGSVYALIALGYTMVHGIPGLINFAHGDVLMVGAWSPQGSYQPAPDPLPGARPGAHAARRALHLGRGVHDPRLHHRAHRLPSPAQRAAAGPADHRHRRLLPPPDPSR